MRIPPFELERWQSVWENQVELNISESGVLPLSALHLVDDAATLDKILALPLGYPQTNGSVALRELIAATYAGAHGAARSAPYSTPTPDNVLVTSGGAEANFLAVWHLVEPGDEVVLMKPNYGQIEGAATSFSAKVVPWMLRESNAWQADPAELASLVTSKTKLIAVCNPNNPTGSIMTEAAMDALIAAAARVGAWILADEIYTGAERNGATTPSFWSRYDKLICTNSLSKAYGLPGLRTGWLLAPAATAAALWGAKDYTTIGPTIMSEKLAQLALAAEKRVEIFERTRRIIRANYGPLAEWISTHPEFRHTPPAAGAIAWFAFPNSAEIARRAREEKSLLIVPGEQFDVPNHLRIGFGGHVGEMIQALGRIEELLSTDCAD